MQTLSLEEIKSRLDLRRAISMQEDGFKIFSAGKVDVPPVGYLEQHNPPGAYLIKYGLIADDDVWVVKIAGGPTGVPMSGMMVALSTRTGRPQAFLQDDGYLTQLRTAIAGLISAKYLAPKPIKAIGVLGTGEQARMQIEILKDWTACRTLYVWGRNAEKVQDYKADMKEQGFEVTIAESVAELASQCNLIITTTAATQPLIKAEDIQPGTHITAMGADEPGKIELDPKLVAKADIVVVDYKSQCIHHGEICRAYEQSLIADDALIELGEIIADPSLGRTDDSQITIADLTGVAVQDIQIAKAVISA